MNERYVEIADFDPEAVGRTLRAEPRSLRDVAHGDGEALTLAEGKAQLEIYPGAGVARVTTADARVEIYRVPGYSLNADVGRVVFDQGTDDDRTRLLVQHNGRISFHPVLRAVQSPTTAETPTTATQLPLGAPVVAEPPTATQPNAVAQAERSEGEEPTTITVTGRLGHDPVLKPKENPPFARVALAHNDHAAGRTTWYNVLATGDMVDQLSDRLRGDEVRISGTLEKPATGAQTKKPTFRATEIVFIPPPPKKQARRR